MGRSFSFAIVRLAPQGVRDERINIGAVVFADDGIDMRLPRRLDKLRVISAALTQASIRDLADAIVARDIETRVAGIGDPEGRRRAIGRVGPLTFSELGKFAADSQVEYESRIASIFSSVINPEPPSRSIYHKRSRLLTQLKRALREEKVLARKGEDIHSHRVVPRLMLAEGLIADLALQNGAMHIIETVDVSDEDASIRRAVQDIAVSALVLEQARINFGEKKTKTRLVYSASPVIERSAQSCLDAAAHQGAELINWASTADQIKFITTIRSLATPTESKRERAKRFVSHEAPKLKLA